MYRKHIIQQIWIVVVVIKLTSQNCRIKTKRDEKLLIDVNYSYYYEEPRMSDVMSK